MSGSNGTKRRGIPSWQTEDSASSHTSRNAPESDADAEQDLKPETLRQQAAKFLEDEDVRTASIERKKAFLGSKGLTEEEVQDLLQDQGQLQKQHAPEAEVMEDYGIEKETLQLQNQQTTPVDETGQASSSDSGEKERPTVMSDSGREHSASSAVGKDVPPIITYPEFLLHSQKPPPLMTTRRLLTTLYAASGVAAIAYGASTYLVQPMVESLTSARHSLAGTALTNLDNLNSKLASAVSTLPETITDSIGEDDSEVESVDSDPSRFFSRSAGTQTSPIVSSSASSISSTNLAPISRINAHDSALSTLKTKLTDIQPMDTTDLVKASITELQKYLEGLPEANDPNQTAKLWEKGQSDEYGKLKSNIRGVKGVLLSARNFPSGVSIR